MTKRTILKPLKQSNKEEKDIPFQFTKNPAQVGLSEACSASIMMAAPAVAAPPKTPGTDKKLASRTGRQ